MKVFLTLCFIVFTFVSVQAADITVGWTAVAEDGDVGGPASGYVLCYSVDSAALVNASNPNNGFYMDDSLTTTIDDPNVPGNVGDSLELLLTGLADKTDYWFAMKAYDGKPNYSGISNIAHYIYNDTIPPGKVTIFIK